ncbi:hypothetical protein HMPREF0277_0254 [Corynebacterium accolens ATCC 49726]|nr:hypothetical protein HMPREF0277_0254 [Corynebacterium accolens ATCC 49726]
MIRSDLRAIPGYVPGARHDDALKLSSNEATQPPLPEAAEAMVRAAAEANRYPDIAATELREDLAEHLGVSFDQVTVGTGSSALCQQLVQITTRPGEEVIFPWRSFEAYPILPRWWVRAPSRFRSIRTSGWIWPRWRRKLPQIRA